MFHSFILINTINGRSILESADKCKTTGKINIKYSMWNIIRSVCPYDWRNVKRSKSLGQHGPDQNQDHLFFVFFV